MTMKTKLTRGFITAILLFISIFTTAVFAHADVYEDCSALQPMIRAYANESYLESNKGQKSVSCTVQNGNDFWNRIYIFSIFNMNNHISSYTLDEIEDIAYAMFRDFDGDLPEAPDGFFTDYGASISGDVVTFQPATPEEQEFEWVECTENSDGSLDVVYYQKWEYDSNWYYMAVHYVPYRGKGTEFKYTIDSIRLDREMQVDYHE